MRKAAAATRRTFLPAHHAQCYDRNPGFCASTSKAAAVRCRDEFTKADLETRSRQIAERIWNPADLQASRMIEGLKPYAEYTSRASRGLAPARALGDQAGKVYLVAIDQRSSSNEESPLALCVEWFPSSAR
jgi:hypothetical protein